MSPISGRADLAARKTPDALQSRRRRTPARGGDAGARRLAAGANGVPLRYAAGLPRYATSALATARTCRQQACLSLADYGRTIWRWTAVYVYTLCA